MAKVLIDFGVEDDEEEATKLMVHHLSLACAFFEMTHNDDGKRAHEVIEKTLGGDWANAASAFVMCLCAGDDYEVK